MSYSQIRAYFKKNITLVNPSYKEWRDALVFDDAQNIPLTQLGSYYHLEIANWVSSPAQNLSIQDQFTATLTMFKNGFKKPIDALDSLLDDALCFRQQLINPKNVEEYKALISGNIEAIENVSGSAVEIDSSNDNIIKIALEFNVRLYFSAN